MPVVSDLRDVIANAGDGEWGYALLSGVGLIPIAGDSAKIAGTLGEFIYADEIGEGISSIAKKYKNLECVECADNIKDYLKGIGQSGIKIDLKYGDGFIIHELYSSTEAISTNGKHYAILYNNKVYDNLFPNGIEYDKWLNGFIALWGEKIVSHTEF